MTVTPLKSVLRTSTSTLASKKRGIDEVDDGHITEPPSSPTKRRKVVIDESQNIVVDFEVAGATRSLEETKEEVRRALVDHIRGQTEGYDCLKEIFARDRQGYQPLLPGDEEDDVKPGELLVYIVALTSQVPLLGKSCSGLVKTILKCTWIGRDEAFFKAYVQFLAALVSAQGSYLTSVLSMMVDWFRESRPASWKVPDFPSVDQHTMMDRLHSTLQHLLKLFPTAQSAIVNIITQKFPYSDESKRAHMTYIESLLRLKCYAPDIETDIMALIVDRLVKIDVQTQVDLDDLDDNIASAVSYQLRVAELKGYEEDEEDEDSDADSVLSDETDQDEEADRIEAMTNNVKKMDAILDRLFRLYNPLFVDPDSDGAYNCYENMLAEFTEIVLPAMRSRHTQFLVFHYGQKSERLLDAFFGTCMDIAFHSNKPMPLKQAATAYLASFVARGAHVPASLVSSVFRLLCHHLETWRTKYEPVCRGPDLQRFAPFYTTVQAILYIFCFRWKELVASVPDVVDPEDSSSYIGHDLEWLPGTRDPISQAIYSRLNPLRVCTSGIVAQFAKLAHHLQFMYVYPLLDANKRVNLSQFYSGAYGSGNALRDTGYADGQDESRHELESHFPFDPYTLPLSRRWVDPSYINWKAIPGIDDVDEDGDESDTSSDEEARDEDEGLAEEEGTTDDNDEE